MYKKDNIKSNSNNEVSKDTVYSELYTEMRRYRDYELTASTWYIVILLAILGAILTVKFGPVESDLSNFFKFNLLIQLTIAGFATLIGVGGCYSVIFASLRYHELRKYVDRNLEPKWKKFKPKERRVGPHYFILLTQALLTIAIDIIILC